MKGRVFQHKDVFITLQDICIC
ncbi:hypothetical protein RDI58_001269 [Solanum bulbocastanum]|uniref:Uncharacterized protein n=1 Tax=Solanum bulbocastanum TaxID=147425 RepID=A0AAN8UCC7_SOLBU